MKVGDKVIVVVNRHPDVISGTIGSITETFEDGFGVMIDGMWLVANEARDFRRRETRVVWFSMKELTLCQS